MIRLITNSHSIHKRRHLAFLFLLFASILAITLSLFAQFGLKHPPCKLCYLQRLPYLLIALSSLAGLASHSHKQALFATLVFLVLSCILGLYHLFIQTGLLPDPCTSPVNIQTPEAFLALLQGPPPCSVKTWSIFNIPISGYNALFSGCLLLVSIAFNRACTNQSCITKNHALLLAKKP